MSQTLIEIINQIKPRKSNNPKTYLSFRSSPYQNRMNIQQSKMNCPEDSSNEWTLEQDKIFYNVLVNQFQFMETYGIDFSLIEGELPGKTRKQIRKKYDKTEAVRKRQQIMRKRLEEQRKKTLFEEQILELAALEAEQQNNNPKPNTHIN